MGAYDDYLRLLQGSQQGKRLDNPYSGLDYMLSSAIQGFLIGKDRRDQKVAREALSAALSGSGGGGLLSGQVSGMANGYGLPDYQGVRNALGALKGNPYAEEMLVKIGLGDLENAGKTRNKLIEQAHKGAIDMDVYRDRRNEDMGYLDFETDELYEREKGKTEQYNIRGESDLDRAVRQMRQQAITDVWENRETETEDTAQQLQREINETEQLGIRGEGELDRLRRQYGYQTDEALRKKSGETAIDVQNYNALNPEKFGQAVAGVDAQGNPVYVQFGTSGTPKIAEGLAPTPGDEKFGTPQKVIGPDGNPMMVVVSDSGTVKPLEGMKPYEKELALGDSASQAGVQFFQSKGIEGDLARVLTGVGPRILSGGAVSPEERIAFNYAVSQATQPKTLEVNGQLITIPAMTQDQLFQGISLGSSWPQPQALPAPQAQEQPMPSRPPLSVEALVKAVIKQESGGNPRAVSPVGARGLMQLMPGTAVEVAKEIGMGNFKVNFLDNPEVNMKLGTYYLQKQLNRFGNNVPMALAAYNAGPHRVDQWRKKYGDPLKGEISVREWVNRIPFKETKGYVKNIMANLVRQGVPAQGQSGPPPPRPLPSTTPPGNIPLPPSGMSGGLQLPPGAQIYEPPPSRKETAQISKEQALAEKARIEAEAKAREDAAKVEAQARERESSKFKLQSSLDAALAAKEILRDPGILTTGDSPVGYFLGSKVNTPERRTLQSYYDQLKSNLTLDSLKALKQSSPTGASGLGSTTENELKLLADTVGSLDVNLPAKRQREILDQVDTFFRIASGEKAPEAPDLSKMSDDELKRALGIK